MRLSRRTLRKIRHATRASEVTGINLVSMIDIFTILVIYLLVNTAAVQIVGADQVELPKSVEEKPPQENVAVIVSSDDILVNGKFVLKVVDAEKSRKTILEALRAELAAAPPPLSQLTRAATEPPPEAGVPLPPKEVTILADKDIPYSLLKKIMATCAEAGFGKISLAVLPRGGPPA